MTHAVALGIRDLLERLEQIGGGREDVGVVVLEAGDRLDRAQKYFEVRNWLTESSWTSRRGRGS